MCLIIKTTFIGKISKGGIFFLSGKRKNMLQAGDPGILFRVEPCGSYKLPLQVTATGIKRQRKVVDIDHTIPAINCGYAMTDAIISCCRPQLLQKKPLHDLYTFFATFCIQDAV